MMGSPRSLVVVSRDHQRLELMSVLMLDASGYDVICLETIEHGYSRIKREHPVLVMVFLDVDDSAGCQLLSMLESDGDLCDITVLTQMATPTLDRFDDLVYD
jgi:DNA-binding response OmpR family regulator